MPIDTSAATLTTTDNVTFTLNNLDGVTATSGTYVLTVKSTGSGIADPLAGNPLTSDAGDAWTRSLPAWLAATGNAASWDSLTKVLTVTGATAIVADPGGDAPTLNASGTAASLTIDPATGRAVRLGALHLSNGATATLASLGRRTHGRESPRAGRRRRRAHHPFVQQARCDRQRPAARLRRRFPQPAR